MRSPKQTQDAQPHWHTRRNSFLETANPNYPNVFTSAIRSLAHELGARLHDLREASYSFSNRLRQTRGGAGQSHSRSDQSHRRVFTSPPNDQPVDLTQADIDSALGILKSSGLVPMGTHASARSLSERENISAAEISVNPAPDQTTRSSSFEIGALPQEPGSEIQAPPSTEALRRLNAGVAIPGSINSSEMPELGGHDSSYSVSDSSVGNDQGSEELRVLGNPLVSPRDSSTPSTPLTGLRAIRGSGPESQASSASGSASSSPLPVLDRLTPDSPPSLSRLEGQSFGSPAVGVDNLDNRSEAESIGACGLPAALIKIINDLFHSLRF